MDLGSGDLIAEGKGAFGDQRGYFLHCSVSPQSSYLTYKAEARVREQGPFSLLS